MALTIVLERWPDRSYIAYVRELPGCVSEGYSRAEAVENINEAIGLYLEDCAASGTVVPASDPVEYVELDNKNPWEKFALNHPSPELRHSLELQGFKYRADRGKHILLLRQEPYSRVIIMKRLDRESIDAYWDELDREERLRILNELVSAAPKFVQQNYFKARTSESDEPGFERLRQGLIDGYVQKAIHFSNKEPGTVVNLRPDCQTRT